MTVYTYDDCSVCCGAPDCETDCAPCNDGTSGTCGAPVVYNLIISGVTNNSCTLCNAINGTWQLIKSAGCNWQAVLPPVCEPSVGPSIFGLSYSGGTWFLASNTGALSFGTMSAAAFKCSGVNNLFPQTWFAMCNGPATVTVQSTAPCSCDEPDPPPMFKLPQFQDVEFKRKLFATVYSPGMRINGKTYILRWNGENWTKMLTNKNISIGEVKLECDKEITQFWLTIKTQDIVSLQLRQTCLILDPFFVEFKSDNDFVVTVTE